ncbi:DUF6597 domain-containing transcriptional factor [Kitasatospora sp. NPDC059571]|uniref:DUF6597 domain-containing transcriptional factor n=1 Tax=Kitasatospora sp. NPDC059571 TaxID=3346871 RepID=UPI0036B6A90C
MTSPDLGRGVLHPGPAAAVISLTRHDPAPELARFVEFYWSVRWSRDGRPAYEQKVLAHPNIHLVLEAPSARIYGVNRSLFIRRLEGAGQVLGVKFRAGGFRPFVGRSVADLADRAVPAAEVLGPETDLLNDEVLRSAGDPAALVPRVDAFLLARLPEPDPVAEQVAAMVGRMTGGSDLRRVDQVAEEFGITVRRLQRLFAEYVGASPKWVLRRARLHEAAERADRGTAIDWAALAADLGYADQAHFTRDFTAAVGTSPGRYAAGGG